jgi:hypothetical protein
LTKWLFDSGFAFTEVEAVHETGRATIRGFSSTVKAISRFMGSFIYGSGAVVKSGLQAKPVLKVFLKPCEKTLNLTRETDYVPRDRLTVFSHLQENF